MSDNKYEGKGSLWPTKAFRGSFDIGGETHYIMMVATQSKNEKAPVYKAIIEKDRHESVVAVWKDDKPENKRVGYFEFAEHFVSLFNNERRPDGNPNAPIIGLMANPKEPPAQQAQPPQQSGDEPPQTEETYGF